MKRFAAITLCAVMLGATENSALAQDRDYPSKPVRLIIPAAPGGNPDVLARLIAQKLSESFGGRAFVAENAPGAGGVVATDMVARAQPDGHTLLLSDSGAMAISVAMNPKLTYQPLRDFAPITLLASVPTLLVVHPSVPSATLAELVAHAKAQPGRVSFGSAGNGSIHHLTMAIFAARTGVDLLHVPYKGGTAMVAGILSNQVSGGFSGIPNVLQLIRAGKLKVIGISTRKRSVSVPDIPTLSELGLEGFDVATSIGLVAPAGTPREIIARLQVAAARAVREPDVAARLQALGIEVLESGTEYYARYLREDIERFAQAVKAAGVKLE
jgi:tripartite-type tricarboxylate transporter receptor subunit TctC